MSNDYNDLMGEVNLPVYHKATQHYAGDVVNYPGTLKAADEQRMGSGMSLDSLNKRNPGMTDRLKDRNNVVPLKPEFK